MKASIKITDDDIRKAISRYVENTSGLSILPSEVVLKVRSKQNYKNREWEIGEILCEFEAAIQDPGV